MQPGKLLIDQPIYVACDKLVNHILDITPNFPQAYKFSVGGKMHDLAIRMVNKIAAAYISRDRALAIQSLIDFITDLETLTLLVRTAGKRRWLSIQKHADIIEIIEDVGKQATGWKNSLIRAENKNMVREYIPEPGSQD